MAVFSLTNTAQRVDQAVNAVHSGQFVNGSGVVYQSGNQSISDVKTFNSAVVSSALRASGSVSGELSPINDGLVNIGSPLRRFGMIHATGFTGTNAVFGGNVTINGTLNANLNIGATGLTTVSVTGTGFISNLRVSGTSLLSGATTALGAINSSGNNNFSGQNVFGDNVSFKSATIFETTQTTSGASSFGGLVTASTGILASGPFSHTGTANMTGTFNHSGNIFQVGASNFTGNIFAVGNFTVTGDTTIANGTTTIRGPKFFTTGSSMSDRFGINQNVDHTGNYNLTGSLRVSANLDVTGNATIDGNLDVSATGHFDGFSNQGNLTGSGTNVLTGNNSLLGNNFVTGNTTVSGNVTFNNNTGELVQFGGFIRPRIIAAGLGNASSNGDYVAIGDFWSNQSASVVSPNIATGNWITQYTGIIGEMGLFLTGSTNPTNSAVGNNGLPVGTASFPVYGRPLLLINVGTTSGTPRSGIWFPLGI